MNKTTKNILSFSLIFGVFILNTFITLKIALAIFLLCYIMAGGLYRAIGIPLILTFVIGVIPYLIVYMPIYFMNKKQIKKIIFVTLTIHLIECLAFSSHCMISLSQGLIS